MATPHHGDGGCAQPAGAWPTWVLSNHDNPRHRTRYGGDERIARAAAVLLLSLRGTPFLYAGEEFGMGDAAPTDPPRDPAGRDGCRSPIAWTATPPHGWRGVTPWLPFGTDASTANPEVQADDPTSMLSLYRAMLQLRRAEAALHRGEIRLVPVAGHRSLLAFDRIAEDRALRVLVNMGEDAIPLAPHLAPGILGERGGSILIRSDPAATTSDVPGALAPYEAAVLG
ncbi:MAG: alpha-amylase family glycosyl hydrolase [Microthrixaceae bacterium]